MDKSQLRTDKLDWKCWDNRVHHPVAVFLPLWAYGNPWQQRSTKSSKHGSEWLSMDEIAYPAMRVLDDKVWSSGGEPSRRESK